MTTRVSALLVAVVFLVVSCQKHGEPGFGEGKQRFRELLELRDQITKAFNERVSDVSIADDTKMTVKLVDSPVSSRGREEKQQRADAIAAFVQKNYKRPLTAVSIQFVSETAGAGETYVGRASALP
jgi:hypothetical protein